MASSMLPHHFETSVVVSAPADTIFSYVDDHTRVSAHMRQSSWMLAGSRLAIELDASEGRTVGARIRLSGRVPGLQLAVEEIVTECHPPLRKVWETTGTPRLLVIGHYRMGYEITPQGDASGLRVFIDYALPGQGEDELLRLAASVERGSQHPLAAAIVAGAQERRIGLADIQDFRAVTGKGVVGRMDGRAVALGNRTLLEDLRLDASELIERA